MNPEYQPYELIDRYLKKELNREETEAFHEKLSSDPEFSVKFQAQKKAHQLIIEGEMIRLMDKMKKDLSNDSDPGYPWKKIILLSALSLVAVSSLILFLKPPHKEVPDTKMTSLTGNKENEIPANSVQRNNSTQLSPGILNSGKEKNKTEGLVSINKDSTHSINSSNHPITQNQSQNLPNSLPHLYQSIIDNTEHQINQTNDCTTIKITADLQLTESCDNEGTGTLNIHSIHGGTEPYFFSMDKKTFLSIPSFYNISAGEHLLYIRDNNNCITSLPFTIKTKSCEGTSFDDVFAPLNGESWKIPLKEKINASLQIYSKNRALVYSANIINGYPSEWDGKDHNGSYLSTGMYFVLIRYENGEEVKGYVSIIQ
jgi:hypothetical protein